MKKWGIFWRLIPLFLAISLVIGCKESVSVREIFNRTPSGGKEFNKLSLSGPFETISPDGTKYYVYEDNPWEKMLFAANALDAPITLIEYQMHPAVTQAMFAGNRLVELLIAFSNEGDSLAPRYADIRTELAGIARRNLQNKKVRKTIGDIKVTVSADAEYVHFVFSH